MTSQMAMGVGLVFLLASGCKFGAQTVVDSSETAGAGAASTAETCDVIVMGGTTAGVAAAISAAKEFQVEGASRRACLVEPTDWPGGQLTSSGVTAVDFAHHKVPYNGKTLNMSKLTRDVQNNSRVFVEWMNALAPARNGYFEMSENPGKCWVSVRCYQPEKLVGVVRSTLSSLESSGALKVYYNAVPKLVTKAGRSIASVLIVQRTPKANAATERLSVVVGDWYSPEPSALFGKRMVNLRGASGKNPVVIDATEWGELLVLSRAAYMQGVEASEALPEKTNAACGQAIVYPMAIAFQPDATPVPQWAAEMPVPYASHYHINDESGAKFTWQDVWTYRRIAYGVGGPKSPSVRGVPPAAKGDISEQNWTLGNDFPYGYLFLSPSAAQAQIPNWRGGVNFTVLAEAEQHAVGWYKYLRENAPAEIKENLLPAEVLGTRYGISKVPYIRDTRRSVGVGGFVMKYQGEMVDGFVYPDSIGVGSYVPDVHATRNPGCSMPAHIHAANHSPMPFTLAMRAHTNRDVDNLLVAGKTMAQTFLVNAATRLHPIEFASGTGAGVMAAYMQQKQLTSPALVSSTVNVDDVKDRINANHGGTQWKNIERALE